MDVLNEKIRSLSERLAEFISDVKHNDDESRHYRHQIRDEIQKIVIELDREVRAGENRTKLIDQMMRTITEHAHRLELLEQRRNVEKGAFDVIKVVWGAAGALIMLGIDYAIRQWEAR